MPSKSETSTQLRVTLSSDIRNKIARRFSEERVSTLAKDTGVPYGLMYNVIHGRTKSLSVKDYKQIFKEEPPYQETNRVDGSYFRDMVHLWVFLNDTISEAALYKEFSKNKKFSRVDYRIFHGDTKTIESRLENLMEQKFINLGISRSGIKSLIKEFTLIGAQERVPYEEVKPILNYLKKNLKVNPSRILHQCSCRYESGELKTVTREVFGYAKKLKKRTEKALNSASNFEIEKIREEVYGKREGFTLFYEVEEELAFLKQFGGKSPRQYLGRSISHYKKRNLKRISSHVVQKIKEDCAALIERKPNLLLSSLPKTYLRFELEKLSSLLKSHSISLLMNDLDGAFEKRIVTPADYSRKENVTDISDLIDIDKAAYILGMTKMAFDLLIAAHTDIIRRIGTHIKKWFLPYRYLITLKEKKGFDLLKDKYEFLARSYQLQHRSVAGSKKGSSASIGLST